MKDTIIEEVTTKILQFLAGTTSETNKFEVKRRWYNLKDELEKFEFLKDITALVNSYGGENAYIVFGIDDKSKEITSTKLQDSGFDDASQIRNVIDGNVDSPVRFDHGTIDLNGNQLYFLCLHPSTEKPHYILSYKNKKGQIFPNEVFIRTGASNTVANKSDIDRMYVERRNIIVERKLEVSINISLLSIRLSDNRRFYIDHPITIENIGMRTVIISRIDFELCFGEGDDFKNIYFYSTEFSYQNLIINQNGIFNKRIIFETLFDDTDYYSKIIKSYEHTNTKLKTLRVTLSNNETIIPKLYIHTFTGKFPITEMDFLF